MFRINKKTSYWLALIIVFGILLSLYLLNLGQKSKSIYSVNESINNDKIIEKLNASGDQSSIVLEKFHRSESRGDKKLWEIEAEKGKFIPSNNAIKLFDSIIDFYQKDGTLVKVISKNATVYLHGEELDKADFTNGVVVHYGDKYTITTEEASYDKNGGVNKGGSVISNTHTEIKGDGIDAYGEKLYVDIESKGMKLSEKVKTILLPKKQK